jgi:hypothetical protein
MKNAAKFFSLALPSFVVAGALVACVTARDEASDGAAAAVGAAALPCDVDGVLQGCRNCHASTPRFGAPMPLVTYDDFMRPAVSDPTKKVYEVVHDRVHSDTRPMPPPPNERLSAGALGVVDRWFAGGAPSTAASCDGGAGTPPPPSLSCTPDLHMAPASPWSMPETTDDIYVCYGFDVTSPSKRQLIGMAPRIDNPQIVHHLLVYQSDHAMSPTPTPCSSAGTTGMRVVYGWAPGGQSFEFPPDVGYPQDTTTHYVMQIHYNNVLHRAGQLDTSGLDFCTTDQLRTHDADALVFGPHSFQIPPRSTTDLSCDVKLPVTITTPLHLFSAMPHMHQLGSSISTTRLATATEPAEDLGARTAWDFGNQYFEPIDATLNPGDTVRTRCVWKNAGDTAVTFGETTEDEMCFSFTMYWPRITTPGWSWGTLPLLTHCQPTPPSQ